MKRLLIVDDEHHIVNWLADLFEGQQQLDLSIYTAYNGKEALQLLRSIKIDIVLLDIRMPGMDGLEVSENILADWPGCHIIFLTGYNQFDYIYYANKHKQIDYLLKTESDEEIIRVVTNAIEAIDKEQKQREMSIQAASKEQFVNHLFQREYLRKLFMGGALKESELHSAIHNSSFPLKLNQPVILLYGKIGTPAAESYYDQFYDMISKSIQVMEQVLYHKFHYAMLDYDESTIVWFLQPTTEFTERNSQAPLQYIKECFDDIISFYKRTSSCEIMLLLYHKEVAWKDVHNTFLLMNQSALLSPPSGLSQSYGAIYKEPPSEYMSAQTIDTNLLNSYNTKLNEMALCLNRGDIRQFTIILNQLKSSCSKLESMHHLPMIELYQKISSLLISYINKYQLVERITPKIGLYPLYFTHDFESWQAAFDYLEKLTEIIFALDHDNQLDNAQNLVLSIKEYIHSHLSSNLTLSALSDVVNYNGAYVSRIFKQISGMNISGYITTCRINKAKELLQGTNENISAIARKVGFDTPQYFSMVFQKEVGLTPSKFREVSQTDTSL